MDWAEIAKSLVWWGPGAMIAGLLIWTFYRLADKFIEKAVIGFMSLGTDFVAAQKEQAVSLAKLAHGTEGLRDCINVFVNRDNQEHREIIILLKYTREQIETLTDHMDTLVQGIKERRHDRA